MPLAPTRHTISIDIFLLAIGCALLIGCNEAEQPKGLPPDPPAANAAEAKPDNRPPFDHLAHPPSNPRAALIQALDHGLLANDLSHNDKLRAILRVAGVPEASQTLVFSKTSLQIKRISPSNPRAIYFNDNCYIAYVPGGLIEYGDADPAPNVGSGLLTLSLSGANNPSLQPHTSCLSCHQSSRTNSRPGFFIRSVFPDDQGHVITSAGSTTVGHDTPLAKRWGGWYVTGQSGSTHHRGNQTTQEQPNGDAHINNALGSNLNDLSNHFDVNRYLQPTSDIVALMVLEHQVQMHNLLTQGRSAVHEQYHRAKALASALDEPFDPKSNATLQRVIQSNAKRIVKHLLFCDEVALTALVSGTDRFIEQFRANRKEDSQGRSLKDFDLQTRMFKYRCSYMVYSQAFDLMQPMLKQAVCAKLHAVLTGADQDPSFGHLTEKERQAILIILRETEVL